MHEVPHALTSIAEGQRFPQTCSPAGQPPAQGALASMHAPWHSCWPFEHMPPHDFPSQVAAPLIGASHGVQDAPQVRDHCQRRSRPGRCASPRDTPAARPQDSRPRGIVRPVGRGVGSDCRGILPTRAAPTTIQQQATARRGAPAPPTKAHQKRQENPPYIHAHSDDHCTAPTSLSKERELCHGSKCARQLGFSCAAVGSEWAPFLFALHAGTRLGEHRAMRRTDVDFGARSGSMSGAWRPRASTRSRRRRANR